MDFGPLLENPEKYRAGSNYKATHIVFPVNYKGERYIVKRPRRFGIAAVINAYYALQGGKRKIVSGKDMIEEEARKLRKLDGYHAPALCGYQKGVIIKEFLEGAAFRDMAPTNMLSALESAVESLSDIHARGIIMGSCHAKNIIYHRKESYFCDFDGVFDESDILRAKVSDLLGLIYSSFMLTRDRDIVIKLAEAVRSSYFDKNIIYSASSVLRDHRSGLMMWFAARMPLNDDISKRAAEILSV